MAYYSTMSCISWILVGTLIGLFVCHVTAQFPIEVIEQNNPTSPPNERTLICRVNSGVPGVYNSIENAIFYLNETTNIRDELPGSDVEYSTGTITIQLRQELEGYYTCGDGTTTSPDSVTLVYQPSANGDIDLYHAERVGGSVTLPCGVKQGALAASYTPTWYHGGFIELDIHSPGSRFLVNRKVLEDFSLTITYLLLSDNGTYHCEVSVGGTSVESPMISLLVYDEPTVQYMTGDQVPFLPSSSQPDAVFTCNATGTPNLAVRWKHNNKEIISSDNKYSIAEVRTAGMSSVLTIKGVRLTDSGNVTCEASVSYINDRGNDSHTNAMRTISETLSRKLVVLDTSLSPHPFVTQDSDLLVKIALSDTVLSEAVRLKVKLTHESTKESEQFEIDGTFSGISTFYPFIPASQVPTDFRRFWLQVALAVNNVEGPFSPPNVTTTQFVDLDEEKCEQTENNHLLYIVGGVIVLLLTVITVVSIILIVAILYYKRNSNRDSQKDRDKERSHERELKTMDSRDMSMEVFKEMLNKLLEMLDSAPEDRLHVILQQIDRYSTVLEEIVQYQNCKANGGEIQSEGASEKTGGGIRADGGFEDVTIAPVVYSQAREDARARVMKLLKRVNEVSTLLDAEKNTGNCGTQNGASKCENDHPGNGTIM